MKLPKYQLSSSDLFSTYEFTSEGQNGIIQKIVRYEATNIEGVYNLAFGDKDYLSGDFNDTDKYPNAWVYATGSTKARTRLYRIGISKYISEITEDFEIYGEINDEWKSFEKNIDFDGFLVKRKTKNS